MKTVRKLIVMATSTVSSAALHAHEGHAAVNSAAHELQHVGWVTAALLIGSAGILLGLNKTVRYADKRSLAKKRHF